MADFFLIDKRLNYANYSSFCPASSLVSTVEFLNRRPRDRADFRENSSTVWLVQKRNTMEKRKRFFLANFRTVYSHTAGLIASRTNNRRLVPRSMPGWWTAPGESCRARLRSVVPLQQRSFDHRLIETCLERQGIRPTLDRYRNTYVSLATFCDSRNIPNERRTNRELSLYRRRRNF